MPQRGQVVLVTGWPGFIGRRLVQALSTRLDRRMDRVVLLTRAPRLDAARTALAGLGLEGEVLEGDVTHMHLGLSGAEYKRLGAQLTRVWHLAALYDLGADADEIRSVNLEGTRRILELARSAQRLKRLNVFSTAYVSGDRQGVILEDELEMGQRFRNAYERSKFEAEVLVRRAMQELPATVFRPSIVVGDSKTGEIDRFEGPYYLAILLVASPLAVPLPLAGDGSAPLNIVPVDFVVDAALSIGDNPAGIGRTVHLTDPAPLSTRKVYELIAERAGKSLPQVAFPHRAVEALLSLPLIERLARPHRNAIRLLNHLAIYNCRYQLELLAGTGIRCPPITDYLDRLIEFVKAHFSTPARPPTEQNVEDPLA